MKVSLNVIKSLINFELPPIDELVARVNAQLGGVEEVIDLGAKYAGARIVRVVKCDKHPDADRLSTCMIDDGGVEDVERNEDGLVQVVCGAPNVHENMWAVWLPPGTAVPASFNDEEPFVLSARPLRGVVSQGMLAAGDELDINNDHDGIVEIRESDLPSGAELQAGAKFAEVFGLNDYVLDIENKMFTHRPDCFGQLGVAREIAGIFGREFASPDWYCLATEFTGGEGLQLEVFNDAPKKSARFMAVAIKNVEVKPSPLWLQCQLVAMGGKPINNIVDATNYIMLLTAQPTHAYDYDKIRGAKIGVRMAHPGESLTLLNGKTYELDADDIVIADGEGAIGLAGIMGGGNSEVSDSTTNIILECANFDMYTLRRSAMKHGLFTDALTRFNKGQSPLQNAPVLKQLMSMVGGEQASRVFDVKNDSLEAQLHRKVNVSVRKIDNILGGKDENVSQVVDSERISSILGNVEFGVTVRELVAENLVNIQSSADRGSSSRENRWENVLSIEVPFWRTDIDEPEDVVEEVGRLYGFDKLPRELPRRSTLAAAKNSRREIKRLIRGSLSRAGANEVLTYSFVHENIFKKAGQDASEAYKLSNALSPDLQYLRLTVLPSLLDKVHMNIKAGHDEFALFEMGKGHIKMHGLGEDGLPEASNFTDIVYAAKKPGEGAPFYKMRRLVEQLCLDLGLKPVFKKIEKEMNFPVTAPFDQQRSALVETENGDFIGMVGELRQEVIKNFKLPPYVAVASLDTAGIESAHAKRRPAYKPLSKYPSITQDISIKVKNEVEYSKVATLVNSAAQVENGTVSVQPIVIYRPDGANEKTVTFRIKIVSYKHTLTNERAAEILNQIKSVVLDNIGGIVE